MSIGGLILAGGAAGIAAAFNTPLAGVVFAIEELSRSFEERTSGRIYTAVIVAGITSVALVGNYTYFGTTHSVLTGARMWLVVPVCGVLGGLAGRMFFTLHARAAPAAARLSRPVQVGLANPLRLCVWINRGVDRLSVVGRYLRHPDMAKHAPSFSRNSLPAHSFFILKALATLASYVTGIPGGIFAPSLAVGAGLGGELSHYLNFAPAGAVVLLTMAAYFSGVVQAPLTALVIVSEMTGNRDLTLPLMACTLIGRGASALVCREALYRALAKQFLPKPEP